MIKIKKKIIFVVITILVIVTGIIYFNYRFSTNVVYKKRWNIDLPNPNGINSIINYSGAGDYKWFETLNYNEEKVKNIINIKEFKKIDDKMLEIYENVVDKCFIMYLNDEEIKLFNSNFDTKELFVNSNYYAFFELNDENRYYFEFLFLDTNTNKLYSIASDYGPYNFENISFRIKSEAFFFTIN